MINASKKTVDKMYFYLLIGTIGWFASLVLDLGLAAAEITGPIVSTMDAPGYEMTGVGAIIPYTTIMYIGMFLTTIYYDKKINYDDWGSYFKWSLLED